MSIKKISIAGIAGGVVAFFAGWLIYGILLMDFMAAHSNTSINRTEEEFVWWAMIISNLAWGFLLAYIFNRWANINTVWAGMVAGATICFFVGLSYSLSMYALTTLYNDMTGLLVDNVLGIVMGAIIGGVVGLVLGKIKD